MPVPVLIYKPSFKHWTHHTLDTLDKQKISEAIAQDGRELGILPAFAHIKPKLDIHTFPSLSSTSTQLWKMLRTGEAILGSAVIAQQQSAGRGQRGRTWQSSAGGLYLSLALEPNWSITHSAQLTCLSAWGITTALNNLGIAANIKWPNDILYKGKKLGGILTETKVSPIKVSPIKVSQITATPDSQTQSNGSEPLMESPMEATITQAVIGVGINWHNRVPQTGINLLSILEENRSLSVVKNKINCLEVLIALVLRGILQGVIFHQQVGSQVFMKAYQKLLTQMGQTVSLDRSGKLSLAAPTHRLPTDSNPTGSNQWANRSGEVLGVSEEGYLEVALHRSNHRSSQHTENHYTKKTNSQKESSHRDSPQGEILRLKPSEIHIS